MLPPLLIERKFLHCKKQYYYGTRWSCFRGVLTTCVYLSLISHLFYSWYMSQLITDSFLFDALFHNLVMMLVIILPSRIMRFILFLLRSLLQILRCAICSRFADYIGKKINRVFKIKKWLRHECKKCLRNIKRRLCRRKKKKSRKNKAK